jgi:hypothetical protein
LTANGVGPHAGAMDTSLLRLYQRQVAAQCFAAILASETAQNAAKRAAHPPGVPTIPDGSGTREPPPQDVFWANIGNFLTAATNIARTCWGQSGIYRKERKPLRKSLGIKGDSPLKQMAMRNDFEHVDEWTAKWYATSANHMHVDGMVGPAAVIEGVSDADMFRVFDTTTSEVVFWGTRYPLKSLVDEIGRIYPIATAEADTPL